MVNQFTIIIHLNQHMQKVLMSFMKIFVRLYHIQPYSHYLVQSMTQQVIRERNSNGWKLISVRIKQRSIEILPMER